MTLKIYNTLSRKKETFKPIEPGKVRMYVCGPTVYDKAHVGHAMSAMVFDIARRYLEYRGFEVKYVMNFTDVDDKIIDRANTLNRDPIELAKGYIQDYVQNLKDLNIKPATIHPRATEEMAFIIEMIARLVESEAAYIVDGDVYYRVESKEDYGKLSGRKLENMNAGARIKIDERKEHPMDFALWKAAKPGEPAWDSPWGSGRPGWHIECSAMNLHHLGQEIDIHGGGNDLIFPHHENEIAQTEALTHKKFARYWMHNGMLQLKGEKMSKSTGNLISIDEFLQQHPGDIMRLLVINTGYRSPLTFNEDVLEQTERTLDRLMSVKKPVQENAAGISEKEAEDLNLIAEETKIGFIKAMDDDFNTSAASASIFDLVRAISQARNNGATAEQLANGLSIFNELTGVLGLELKESSTPKTNADPFIELLLDLRQELRKEKIFALSDKIRDALINLGIVIKDTKDSSDWEWK